MNIPKLQIYNHCLKINLMIPKQQIENQKNWSKINTKNKTGNYIYCLTWGYFFTSYTLEHLISFGIFNNITPARTIFRIFWTDSQFSQITKLLFYVLLLLSRSCHSKIFITSRFCDILFKCFSQRNYCDFTDLAISVSSVNTPRSWVIQNPSFTLSQKCFLVSVPQKKFEIY